MHGCDLSTTYLGLLEQRQVNPTGKDGYIILNAGGIMFPRISTTFISGVVDKGEYTIVKDAESSLFVCRQKGSRLQKVIKIPFRLYNILRSPFQTSHILLTVFRYIVWLEFAKLWQMIKP